jgi:enamine deaminase RidA (YjgF/YER057c/UK114 family)
VDAEGVCPSDGVRVQTITVLNNLLESLELVGGSANSVFSTTVYLTDIRVIDDLDVAFRSFFSDGR